MYSDYKIYFGQSSATLTTKALQKNHFFTEIYEGDELCEKKLTEFIQKSTESTKRVGLVCTFPGQILCDTLENHDVIVAGGGIVSNSKKELLLIFRRGYWDLPKGKIELKENIADGALREVQEETNIHCTISEPKPLYTYHIYELKKGVNVIKESHWYYMKAINDSEIPIPQTQEDILEAKWVNKEQWMDIRTKAYLMIQNLGDLFFGLDEIQTT